MSTVLVYAPAMQHTKHGHPESNGRIAAMLPVLDEYGLLSALTRLKPEAATMQQLLRVHTKRLVERVRQVSAYGGGLLDHGDTYATADSYNLARLAAGGTVAAVDAIMTGMVKNGIALVRPPGHHAEADNVSGFCLFNNVAVAARQAQAVHNARRIVILDIDVHHGNGTQDIFYNDPSVMFVSMHLFAPYFYPGIGTLNEVGQQKGFGYTVNVPFPPGVGDLGYGRVMEQIVLPKIDEFGPDIMLVSIGFDAHWKDPLAMAGLSLTGYARLARSLVDCAARLCNGRVLFVLEGGYQYDATTYGVLNVINALLGRDEILDPLGPMPYPEQDITHLLRQLKQSHLMW